MRVGLVCLPVAWALVGASEMLTSIIDELPDAFPLTVLGFPLALGLAWAFQVAEKGVELVPCR